MRLILGRSRSVGARAFVWVGGVLFAAFSLGCMNLSFGGRTEVIAPEGVASSEGLQRGNSHVATRQEMCIYYPVAYVSPPNLEFENPDSKRLLQIVEQRPDCFRVVNNSAFGVDCTWKARGILGTTAKTGAVGTQPSETSTPDKSAGEWRAQK